MTEFAVLDSRRAFVCQVSLKTTRRGCSTRRSSELSIAIDCLDLVRHRILNLGAPAPTSRSQLAISVKQRHGLARWSDECRVHHVGRVITIHGQPTRLSTWRARGLFTYLTLYLCTLLCFHDGLQYALKIEMDASLLCSTLSAGWAWTAAIDEPSKILLTRVINT
jgi:hypothetical protein